MTIQQRGSVTGDGQGGRTVAWPTFATVWAHVRPLSAREQLQTGAVTATVEYEVVHPPWRIWHAASARFQGDCSPLYGTPLAACLQREPDSAFLADGSPVTDHEYVSGSFSGSELPEPSIVIEEPSLPLTSEPALATGA